MIESLLALPEDQRPIIILQADEGPWPDALRGDSQDGHSTGRPRTDDELEMKFGILNAWYLPDGDEDLGLYPDDDRDQHVPDAVQPATSGSTTSSCPTRSTRRRAGSCPTT